MRSIKGHSKLDPQKIKKRANEIWKRKREALNTALDDWLQAERELKIQNGLKDKNPSQYTSEDVTKIRERAQAIREEKVKSLRTAFDDWIEAEKELTEELKKKKIDLRDLFDMWFKKISPRVDELLDGDLTIQRGIFDDELGKEYVELMMECVK
jgi:ABC-type phosphate transport system auxiliary subunit